MFLFQVILSSAVTIVLALAIYDWILFIKRDGGVRMTIPQVSLIIIILGMIWRLIYIAVNPLMCRRGAWPYRIDDMFFTAHIPASLAPVFLVSLYHYEITSKTTVHVNQFLKRLRIPFFIATGALFAFEIVMSALRGNGYAVDVVIYINIGVYFVISVTFTVFFFFTSFRVFCKLKQTPNVYHRGKIHRLKNITIWVAISGVGLLYVDLMIFPMLSDNFPAPVTFTATFFNFWLGLTVISFAQVLVYMMHTSGKSPATTSSSMKKQPYVASPPTSSRGPLNVNNAENKQRNANNEHPDSQETTQ